jgi:hypothetical protein
MEKARLDQAVSGPAAKQVQLLTMIERHLDIIEGKRAIFT